MCAKRYAVEDAEQTEPRRKTSVQTPALYSDRLLPSFSIVATDFFSVDTVFFRRLCVLVFIHLGTRRLVQAACTSSPDSAWVTQQMRNLSWTLEEQAIGLNHLIHDRDTKFPRSFDATARSDGGRVILTPLMAPKANAHIER